MSLIKCPYCGTKYSDSYDECPFCDEADEEEVRPTPNRRPPKKQQRNRASAGPELLSPILIIILVLMLALLGYLLFGGGGSSDSESGTDVETEETTPGVEEDTMPEVEPEPEPEVVAPATSVALDKEDFTLNAGEGWALNASGGSGEYTWSTDDATVATVSASGVVTAVGGGNTTLTLTDGFTTAECIVRVKGTAVSSSSSTTTTTTGSVTLSHSDVTISVGESFGMYVSGTTASATYTSGDEGVASVSASGTVSGVASGSTTITASVDGATLSCLVRVK